MRVVNLKYLYLSRNEVYDLIKQATVSLLPMQVVGKNLLPSQIEITDCGANGMTICIKEKEQEDGKV